MEQEENDDDNRDYWLEGFTEDKKLAQTPEKLLNEKATPFDVMNQFEVDLCVTYFLEDGGPRSYNGVKMINESDECFTNALKLEILSLKNVESVLFHHYYDLLDEGAVMWKTKNGYYVSANSFGAFCYYTKNLDFAAYRLSRLLDPPKVEEPEFDTSKLENYFEPPNLDVLDQNLVDQIISKSAEDQRTSAVDEKQEIVKKYAQLLCDYYR